MKHAVLLPDTLAFSYFQMDILYLYIYIEASTVRVDIFFKPDLSTYCFIEDVLDLKRKNRARAHLWLKHSKTGK